MNNRERKKRTVAITGASGLIGRHLCDHFCQLGWSVHALVRDISCYPYSSEGIKVFRCDLPDYIDSGSIDSADTLIHCAYMTRFTNLKDSERVNEEGTMKLYNAAKSAGVAKFVFVSSMAVSANAESYYAQSKMHMEAYLDQSTDLIVRPGLVLAANGGLFNRMMGQVVKWPVIPVFGGGRQLVFTVHIDDLCNVFSWALGNDISGIVAVADTKGIMMKDFIRLIIENMGLKKLLLPVPGMPFVLLLQLAELFKFRLPVSSENLRGLLNRDRMDLPEDDRLKQSSIRIRSASDSIKDLICDKA